jgi:hypothetical protein
MHALRTTLVACACAGALAVVTPSHLRPVAVARPRHSGGLGEVTRVLEQRAGGDGGAFWTSSNWSGYALGSSKTPHGTYTSITGTWTVPTVLANSGTRSSSQWIGIDGATNADLVQTGTYADSAHGKASYGVWWEILPASGTTIHEPVRPGQTIVASIVEDTSTKLWTITISNGSWTFVKTTDYSGKGQSAEWIVEAPLIGGSDARLTRTSRVTFLDLTVDGANPKLVAADGGRMSQGGKITETPSLPAAAGNAFSMQYGAKAPPPPA